MGTDYTEDFYEIIEPGCRTSADAVVPLLHARYAPRTVIDVGCGQGWWGAAFARRGAAVTGLDGPYVPRRAIDVVEHDLTEPLPDWSRVDLVLCLEVAEHLPLERAASFVADLCRLSDRVVFSAAIPWQTGAGHVNLQWQSWWAHLFEEQGYAVDGTLRWDLWDNELVEPWYRQNLLLFEAGAWDPTGEDTPLDVVHPLIHAWGREA